MVRLVIDWISLSPSPAGPPLTSTSLVPHRSTTSNQSSTAAPAVRPASTAPAAKHVICLIVCGLSILYTRGTIFLKTVDASDVVKDAKALFLLFDEVVEWVGHTNIVHMVTDNGSNYVAAGKMISDKYTNIEWSPCACHCLNLILKDFDKMAFVSQLASRASKITVFIYNHIYLLSWLRKRVGWKEIIRPAATRFATTFIALDSLHEHLHDLQALVTSKDFVDSRYAKDKKAKVVVATILDNKFWNDVFVVVQIVNPIIRLLRIADSDERPAIGYIYDGINRAEICIQKMFRMKTRLHKPYTDIIRERWDCQLRKNVHAAAYWLNPAFQYDSDNFCSNPEVMRGLLDVIENNFPENMQSKMNGGGLLVIVLQTCKSLLFEFLDNFIFGV
ncbi:uncharacterized protein LOC120016699 [Tripterygium wilfordii]|uniref:uncharacterized protein LOC120016699 n=1 Tax=Tripterygium wilfordii TaxID=458696 RepID=UPI0018F84926|nr:uncharacterized protein LOC120016699 [Tripterygium wilfordii]